MELSSYFPIWDQLSEQDQAALLRGAFTRDVRAGELLSAGSAGCAGLLVVCSGQLRAYILSEDGREVTIYRLFDRDICLFSASCMMSSIQFDVAIEAEKDSRLWVIPADQYRKVMEGSAALANYTNQLMASRFSEVMWLMEQILWKRQDRRLADFLLEESLLSDSRALRLTHDKIANHLGTAREVVTRMLRYFQSEGMVKLTRGGVEITDEARLRAMAKS